MRRTKTMFRRIAALLPVISVALILSIFPLACTGPGQLTASVTIASALSATMVPNLDLDTYVYVNQGTPTKVPKNLLGTANDINVDSLAVWGIFKDDGYSVSGALTFTAASDASTIASRLPQQPGVWTKLSDRIIYFVQGNGTQSDAVKNAISNNDFKLYNDGQVLAEVAVMPAGGTTKPAGVAIIKPNQTMVNLIKNGTSANNAATIQTVFDVAKPQVIVLGLYAPEPIDIADIMQRAANNTIWDANLGVLASVNSIYPGIVFSPIATKLLDSQNFPTETAGNLTLYKIMVDTGKGQTIPLLVNVDGNHVFAAISGKETYSQALLTGIKR
jgi:hypothetical protein